MRYIEEFLIWLGIVFAVMIFFPPLLYQIIKIGGRLLLIAWKSLGMFN